MRLILVRHGTTTWTDERRYTGRSNPELTAEGRAQAGDVGRFLAGLSIDTSQLAYTQLGELASATDKARRDAPSIAVCEL